MEAFIKQLEIEIRQQENLLHDYVTRQDWFQAGGQVEYIKGLKDALHLARSQMIYEKAKKGSR